VYGLCEREETKKRIEKVKNLCIANSNPFVYNYKNTKKEEAGNKYPTPVNKLFG